MNNNTNAMHMQGIVLRAIFSPLLILGLVMVAGGRLSYWQGWVYGAVNYCILLATFAVLHDNPELIAERLRPGKGMKAWDVVYFALSTPLFLGSTVLAAVDAGRMRWSPQLPVWLYVASWMAFLGGHALFLAAKRANPWLSSVARIQSDRGQTVCDRGPYAVVRHPAYAGGFLFGLATPFVLGSVWAVVPAALGVLVLVWRTAMEDRMLRAELPGYFDYTRRVRFKLIPGLW